MFSLFKRWQGNKKDAPFLSPILPHKGRVSIRNINNKYLLFSKKRK